MFGRTHPGHPQHTYYHCRGKDQILSAKETRCPQRAVRAEDLEKAVWEEVRTLLEEPERLTAQYQEFANIEMGGNARLDIQAQKLGMHLKRLAGEEKRLLDGYQAEIISLEELSERRQGLELEQREQRRQVQ